ncbi:hypothetical protein Ddye_016187 [Dipteronia dyeriana]|uniref:DUF1985 domain-containing protein n=1 Tax=Dipteronia dyeriana TaxID=168575 RepID=A0AAD9U709_9ROSI|nr:hypothetical protein Ddye_016187 [Dipteronia dyeriana]
MSMHRELKFLGGVIHQLLLRELDHDGSTDEMRFLLGNHLVKFLKVEFILVTRLCFGVVPDTNLYVAVENGIHQRYFPRADEVSLEELRVILTLEEFQEAYDNVKLSLIYMLNWILMGVDERLKIPIWQFRLVDDLNAFDTFPWGANIFAFEMFTRKEIVPIAAKAVAPYLAGLSEGGSLYVEDDRVHLPTVPDQTSSAEGPEVEGGGGRCSEMEASGPLGLGFQAMNTDESK